MSLPIRFRHDALDEFQAAGDWYERRQPGRGVAFTEAVQQVLDTIAGQPDRYPVVERDIREAPVVGFPYCVYYRVPANAIKVISVFHNSRDPAAWQSRN